MFATSSGVTVVIHNYIVLLPTFSRKISVSGFSHTGITNRQLVIEGAVVSELFKSMPDLLATMEQQDH